MFEFGPETSGRVIALLVTVVLAQLIWTVLNYVSRQSREAERRRAAEDRPRAPSQDSGVTDGALVPVLLREMETLAIPVAERQRVATALAGVVTKHMARKVEAVTRELTERHEREVEQKVKEVEEVRQQYETTVLQKEQTEAVMRSIAEGLVVVNQKGEVVFMNPAAERLLGIDQRSKLGKPLAEGLKEEQLLSLVKGTPTIREDVEIELSSPQDQTRRIVRSSNAVVQDENGKTIGMVTMLTDITKQKELDRLKSEFASSVTHELRTPIVAMQHSLGLILDEATGSVTDQQRNFLTIAQRNLGRLSGMINDLLDLAKLEAHKMDLKPEQVALAPLIQRVCVAMEAWASSKSIQLHQRVDERIPEITADPERLEQVLNNLIGNAIKFTPKNGTVTIDAKLEDQPPDVLMIIADTGIGIAKEDLEKLFKKFQQLGRQSGEYHGTGLGLALAKEIVELHGGTIGVESEPGTGTRFIFRLPLTQPNGKDEAA